MKKSIFFLIAIASLFSCHKLNDFFPHDPPQQFNKVFGGSGWDVFNSVIKPRHSNSYIASGYTTSDDGDITGHHGSEDFWVVKVNELGNKVWLRSLGGSGEDRAFSSIATFDGGAVVVGYSNSNDGDLTSNNGSDDAWIVKLNKDGNIEWQKNLGGSGQDIAWDIATTITGDYIICGNSATANFQAFIIKMDKQGNVKWHKEFGGDQIDFVYSIQIDLDEGILFTGYSNSNDGEFAGNKGMIDAWIVKLDKYGNKEWQSMIGGSQDDVAYSIVPTKDHGYMVSGFTLSSDGDVVNTAGETWIFKLSKKGEVKWQKRLNISAGTNSTLYYGPDGNFLLATGGPFVVKLDNKGNELWRKNVGGNAESLIPHFDGSFVVAGARVDNFNKVDGYIRTVE